MATIYPLPPNDKGIVKFKAQIRIVGEKYRSGIFDDRASAQKWVEINLAQIHEDREKKKMAPGDIPSTDNYLDEKLAVTLELYWRAKATDQDKKVLPAIVLGARNDSIGQLTESWIEDYIERMRQTTTGRNTFYSYATILKQMRVIKAAIKWRARRLQLKWIPAFNFSEKEMFPKDWENKRERRLEPAEETKLRQCFRLLKNGASQSWRLLMRLAIETGARQSELVKATWSEICELNGLWFWKIPKKHNKSKCERIVPLTVNAVRIIKFLRTKMSPGSPRIFHFFKSAGVVSHLFAKAVKECDIIDYRFHDLRHEAITRFVLRERNFSVDEIMRIMGHKSREMLDRYTNFRGDEIAAKLMRLPPSFHQSKALMAQRLNKVALSGKMVIPTPSCNDKLFSTTGGDHATCAN